MNRSIFLLLIGLLFGGGLGFTFAAANGMTLNGHNHFGRNHAASDMEVHDHDTPLSLRESPAAPSLSLELTPDPMSGWNLHLVTENFAFAPERASQNHVPGEGHAHVYIDGDKVGRFYGPWIHLDNLPDGDVTLRVTLTANNHRPLTVGGVPLTQTVTIRN